MTIRPQKRRWIRRAAVVFAVLCGCTYLSLNVAARWILIHQIRQITGLRAEIHSVRITPTSATVRGIRLSDHSTDQHPLLTVAEIRADLTLLDGFSSGKFADAVKVIRPSIRLEFSADGDLLTVLPKLADRTDGGKHTVVPLRRLDIRDAEILITQPNRQFNLTGMRLAVRCHDMLQFAGVVPRLFDGDWTVQGCLHPSTFAGSATLTAKSVHLRAADLRKLPLVPDAVKIPAGSDVTGSMLATVKIPANVRDLKNCTADLQMELHSLNIPAAGNLSATGVLQAAHRTGRLDVAVNGSILDGCVRLDGNIDIGTSSHRGQLDWSVQSINLDSVCQTVDLPVQGVVNASGTAAATVSMNQIQFHSSLKSDVSRICVSGIQMDSLHSSARVHGAIAFRDGVAGAVDGEMECSVQSSGCQLERVLPRLAGMVSAGHLSSNQHDLDLLLQRLQPRGCASFYAAAKAPLTALQHPEQITATARISGTGISTREFHVDDSHAIFNIANGQAAVHLDGAKIVHLPSGRASSIHFNAGAPLQPEGMATADFRMTEFPLAFPASLTGLNMDELSGDVSVAAVVNVPTNRLTDATAYSGHGSVLAPHVVVRGEVISNAGLKWTLGSGRFSVTQFDAQSAALTLHGNAHLNLNSPYPFAGLCTVQAGELQTLSQVVSRFSNADIQVAGSAGMKCMATGDLKSHHFDLNGQLLFQNVAVKNAGPQTFNLNVRLQPQSLTVESAPGQFFGGDMVTTASLDGRGRITAIAGRIQNIQVPALTTLMKLQTPADGRLAGAFSFIDPLQPDRLRGSASVTSHHVNIYDLDIDGFQTSILAESGAILTTVKAMVAGAACDATFRTAVPALLNLTAESFDRPDQLPFELQARMNQLTVSRIRTPVQQMLGITLPAELTGTIDGSLVRTPETAREGHIATGTVSLNSVAWNRSPVANQLVARMQLKPQLLEVYDVSGTIVDGHVEGRAVLNLNEQPEGSFRMVISGMNLTRAAFPLGKEARHIQGRANLRIDGRIARRLTGRADLRMDGVRAYGVSASHVRVPLQWSLVPAQKVVHVHTNSASLDLGGGRVTGKADVRWNGRMNLNLTAQAQQVDTRRLLVGRASLPGGGVVSGTLRLRGESVTSINDLSGQFDAKIRDAQALKMPVLQNASQFLGSVVRTTSFDDGTLRGRLANGMITIDRMALMAASVRIIAEGTSSLTGQLNLFVSAYTGETGPADKLLELSTSPLMLAAPAPIALVAHANDVIKNRTIHLHVTGRAQKPLIRVQPGRQLQQEVIQLLVKSAFSSLPGGNQIQSAMHNNTILQDAR